MTDEEITRREDLEAEMTRQYRREVARIADERHEVAGVWWEDWATEKAITAAWGSPEAREQVLT